MDEVCHALKSGLSAADWAQIISAVGTAIAAIVAVVAAILSYRSARQNNETNEQMVRPRVVIFVRSVDSNINLIELVVLNEGGGLARDIKLSVLNEDLPLMHSDDNEKVMSDLKVFKDGIVTLPSRTERKYFILSLIGQYDEILAKSSTIKVEYHNSSKSKKYTDEFALDFGSLSSSQFSNDNTKAPKNIADELKAIRQILEKEL